MNTPSPGMPATALAAVFLAAVLVLFPRPPVQAAETAAAGPRIGLALSGGGARGIAHIGVLKVLEELRVPVHCVTGTSMGAIVGGAYASGGRLQDLEQTVVKTDWNKVFTDRPPRDEIASRRKEDDYKTLFAPEYGVKNGGLLLPKGIISGVAIETYFRGLTSMAAGIDDFSKLPIPYRAVASDIETGEAVVLARGNVAQAMRASMAVPGGLAPVEIDGRLLVDGGIANNLPIDEARKLCADVIIAVNISTAPLTREEITSALSISAQLLNFLGKQTVDRQLASLGPRDVLIAPELGNISSGSFERSADAIRIGEAAARAMAGQLGRYSLPPDQYTAFRNRQIRETRELGTVDAIRFEGLQRTNPAVLSALLKSKPGAPLTEEGIGADLQRIYGRGDFEGIDYRIQQEPGSRALVIQPREKSTGPDYLRFGVGLASDFRGENPFNALVSYRKTWLNRLGGEWLNEVQIGQNSHIFTEFYQPVEDSGRYFVAPYASAGRKQQSVFLGSDKIAEYDTRESRAGIDGGAVLGTWGELRVGPLWRRVEAEVDTGSPVLPNTRETSAGMRVRLFADQLDSAFYPRSGYRVAASAYAADEGFGSDRNYQRLEGQLVAARSWGDHTFSLTASGGTDLDSNMPSYDAFTLGGPLRLSGYRINEFSGREMAFGRLMYYKRALHLPDLLGSGIYVGASLEAGRMSQQYVGTPSTGAILSGSVFVGAATFLGPLYFGIGAGEAGRWSLYLLLGVP